MNLLKSTAERLRALWPFSDKRASADTDGGLDKLQKCIGYRFGDPTLLRHACMHRSAIGADDRLGLLSNERMEFLGDSVLNCLVTEYLYKTYPSYAEGQLSKMKSLVVSRKILGEVAAAIDLGRFLVLGASERRSGGQKRKSILSNTFEALVGAMYLDGGLPCVRAILEPHLFERIEEFISDEGNVNYKSTILEMSQRDGFGIPRYTVLSTSGPEHDKRFRVGIEIGGVMLGEGQGTNKKLAQQNAAHNAIEKYNKQYVLSYREGAMAHELVSH